MTRKLKLDFPILDEEGVVLNKDKTAGQIVAASLLRSAGNDEGDILKFYGWAMKLGSNQAIDIDEGDKKVLVKQIVDDKTLPIITKAPVIQAIDRLDFKKEPTP